MGRKVRGISTSQGVGTSGRGRVFVGVTISRDVVTCAPGK